MCRKHVTHTRPLGDHNCEKNGKTNYSNLVRLKCKEGPNSGECWIDQTYLKTLAVLLEKAQETVSQISDNPSRPIMSPAMMSALAVLLQKDIDKVLETVSKISDNPSRPTVSPAMMSALVTLSQEAVKLYEVPYKPKN